VCIFFFSFDTITAASWIVCLGVLNDCVIACLITASLHTCLLGTSIDKSTHREWYLLCLVLPPHAFIIAWFGEGMHKVSSAHLSCWHNLSRHHEVNAQLDTSLLLT
jgi:hypothetical protein